MNSSSEEVSRLGQALADSEAARQLLLDSSLDCIVWTDGNARITEFNGAAERTFRIPRSAVLRQDLPNLLFSSEQDAHRRNLFGNDCAGGIELVGNRIEVTAKRSDGIEFPAEVTVTRVLVHQKASFVVHVRDLTVQKRAEQTVVWLASIIESSQDAIISKDLSGRIRSWNYGAEKMYGYPPAEAIGWHISMLAPPERQEESAAILRDLCLGKYTKDLETVQLTKDGRRIDVMLTVSPVRNFQGVLTGASVLARDITSEKVAKEALRKATETSIYSSPLPIIAVDTEFKVRTWNKASEKVFGWTENEVVGKRLQTIPPEEMDGAVSLYERLLAGETVTGIEVLRRRKDGTYVNISLSATPLINEHSEVRGIIGFHTDITDRKKTENALRQAEEKYRSIFENAVEGIYQADVNGRYISANPALARMFGFDSAEELIGSRHDISRQEYINPDVRLELIRAIEQHDVVHNFEYEALRQDGKRIWLSTTAHAVRDRGRHLVYFEGTVQDITERRDLEQQLRQMQKMEAIGRLAGGVAHDFNNILMAISSYAELLSKKATEESTRRYVGEIAKAVNRGSGLTQGLLTFSRKQVSSPKVLDLNALITGQLDMLKRLIPENIELTFRPCGGSATVEADPGHIEQITMNLVINARDAMPDGGTVTIETDYVPSDSESAPGADHANADQVLLSVRDNGCGMNAETRSHIFEPFYTTKEQGKGTGLGLATVFGIVKQSSGNIVVESEPGQGTTFKIFLPQSKQGAEVRSTQEASCSVAGTETILLVEDETAVRESTAEYLTEQGYTVLRAQDGLEALQIAEQRPQRIDVLVTDVVMPKMSGRALADKVSTIYPEAKIIFISGYSRNLLNDGPNSDRRYTLLQKPFQLNALGRRIRGMLDDSVPSNL